MQSTSISASISAVYFEYRSHHGSVSRVISESAAQEIATQHSRTLAEVYRYSLQMGVCPLRYIKNNSSINISEQLQLAQMHAAVVGAGGLGGYVAGLLARVGVGKLTIIDNDIFAESNLNRQTFCLVEDIGKSKAQVATQKIMAINPSVAVLAFNQKLDEKNACELLSNADIIIDALDSIKDRMILEKAATTLKVPLVHGAVSGLSGQAMTIMPDGENSYLRELYHSENDEQIAPSVLSFMPAIIASIQVAEVVKTLLKKGKPLAQTLLHINISTGRIKKLLL